MLVAGSQAGAAVISTGPFAASTLLTFDGLDGMEVNGLSVSGVTFGYSLGNGDLTIDGGPGDTNHIGVPNIVSLGDDTGVLSLSLPNPATMLEYGYAILSSGPVTGATTVSVFSGATLLGTLSFDGDSDPSFTGGFAGLQSSTPFDRVDITFNSSAAPAFALDNIGFNVASPVPEPATALLVLPIAAGLLWRRRRA